MPEVFDRYIPPSPTGGSRFGGHFLSLYHECPYKWATRFLAPHPDGGQGLEVTTIARALGVGGMFHTFAEAWYRSRVRDGVDTGEADLDAALSVTLDAMAKAEPNWEGEDNSEWLKDRDLVQEMARRYHERYGPGGLDPERDVLQVFCDPETGEPWIEREVEVPIKPGLVYTCRLDLVARYFGTLCVIEHKTTSAGGFWGLISSMDVTIQPAGELLALRHSWPYETLGNPSSVVVNIINKNPPKGQGKTLPFYRDEKTRTDAELAQFGHMAEQTLDEIVERLETYHRRVEGGMDVWLALRTTFPRRGQFTGACYKWNRPCAYINLCQATGFEHRAVAGFRPRTTINTLDKDDEE